MTHASPPHPEPTTEPWREHWFPVAFTADLEPNRLRRVSILGRGYVLFPDARGTLHGLRDRCPHRAARLSDGELRDGRVVCLYHGWCFRDDGACVAIPQMPKGVPIPETARVPPVAVRVSQGIAWVYGGEDPTPDPARIPAIEALDRADCRCIDFAIDLPYGQDYLIENVLDFAHIHVAHDGTRGGGRRELAGPLAFEVADAGAAGFTARFGAAAAGGMDTGHELADARVEFRAPNLVHYVAVYRDPARVSGLTLYSVPLQRGRCRLLYRSYGNTWPWWDRIRPRFWEHGFQCQLLEQDMAVVTGQAEEIRSARAELRDLWLPIRTSDMLVLAFRKWIDEFAADRPDHVGFRGRGPESATPWDPGPVDRLALHTQQCRSCTSALRRCRVLQRWLPVLSVSALAAAIPTVGSLRTILLVLVVFATLGIIGSSTVCRRLAGGADRRHPD